MSLGVLLAEMRSSDAPAMSVQDGMVIDDSPFLVALDPSDTTGQPATRLTSYTPGVGDKVLVLVRGADRCVLGEVTA